MENIFINILYDKNKYLINTIIPIQLINRLIIYINIMNFNDLNYMMK